MDPSFKTQLDIKNRADEIQSFMREMATWEDEIKKTESMLNKSKAGAQNLPPPRNMMKKQEIVSGESKDKKCERKNPMYHYGAWGEIVDAAVDPSENSDSDEDGLPTMQNKTNDNKVEASETPVKPKETAIEDLKFKNLVETNLVAAKSIEEGGMKNIDLAFLQKELGNKFVKEEKWQDAIECYSKSIEMDPSNSVYHANRALCYLKMRNFKAAEVDSTIAIQLDKTYIKAYQRRGLARKALQQYQEALNDFAHVLSLEPNNFAAKIEIKKMVEYLSKRDLPPTKPTFNPKNMFAKKEAPAKERIGKKRGVEKVDDVPVKIIKEDNPPVVAEAKGKVVEVKTYEFKSQLPPECVVVEPVDKPSHLRSKVPLKRIEITETDKCRDITEWISNSINLEPSPTKETKDAPSNLPFEVHKSPVAENRSNVSLPKVPQTYVQFEKSWKSIKDHEDLTYKFLKPLANDNLRNLFGSSLDSAMLSELLSSLVKPSFQDDPAFIHSFLTALTRVERFRSLVLFMKPFDEAVVSTCLITIQDTATTDELFFLREQFGLT